VRDYAKNSFTRGVNPQFGIDGDGGSRTSRYVGKAVGRGLGHTKNLKL